MTLSIQTSIGSYDITLQRGALSEAGQLFNLNRQCLLVTDDGVPTAYVEAVKRQCRTAVVAVIRAGEASKSMASYQSLLRLMVQHSFTRGDCVVAIGGGVVGDLAGFVAASYLRGVDFYNIPTTLLAQVDSSIGGKVAIDFEGYKNIVGAFYPPRGVLIDPDVLQTLPQRQLANGLAEALKMAATHDTALFELLEHGDVPAQLDEIIEHALRIKKSVVEADEKEAGLRKVLNFGHTLAHAMESQTAFQALYHGECVALGMLPMCGDALRPRMAAVLRKLNLPTTVSWDRAAILDAIRHDKKLSGDTITVATVEQPGSYQLTDMPFEVFAARVGAMIEA